MFILLIEKRISASIKDRGKSAPDWYVLVVCALPFAPTSGLELQINPVGKKVFVTVERIVFKPNDGTFWGQTTPLLHPKPNAREAAESLVDNDGWDVAMEASTLEEAKKVLLKKAISKLQSAIKQMQMTIPPSMVAQFGKKRR